MSLNVDYRSVENYLELQQEPVAFNISMALMALGVSQLTEKNFKEAYRRLRVADKVYGTETDLQLSDFQRFVGIKLNVVPMDKQQFRRRMQIAALERFEREVENEQE